MSDDSDEIEGYLADGWAVCGYSVCMMAAGATSHHILLQKGTSLATCMMINPGPKEMGRAVNVIVPKPAAPPKRGFFG